MTMNKNNSISGDVVSSLIDNEFGRELAGDFVLHLYHNRFIKDNAIGNKNEIREEYQIYLKPNKVWKSKNITADQLLATFGFINEHADSNTFKFSFKQIFEYRHNIIAQHDIQRIRLLAYKYANEANKEVDDDSITYDLKFKLRVMQDAKDFVLTPKSCYCCRMNFLREDDYFAHINQHTEESDFEFIYVDAQICPQRFKISYMQCKNSPLLVFTITDLAEYKRKIIIEKIITFRTSSIQYLAEDMVPFELSADGSKFYADYHLFDLMYEQPLIISYTFQGDNHMRFLEEHHFFRNDYYASTNDLKNKRFLKTDTLKFNNVLSDYSSTYNAETVLGQNFGNASVLQKLHKSIRDYFSGKVALNENNVYGVFLLLLDIKYHTVTKRYESYKQNNVNIKGSGIEYSVKFKNFAGNKPLKSVLNEGDQIKLSNNPIEPDSLVEFFGLIKRIAGKRIYFETKISDIPIDEYFSITLIPRQMSLMYQLRALNLLRLDNNLRCCLFPESSSVSKKPSSVGLAWYNESISKNFEQKEAVQNIVENCNRLIPFIILGPPGTGKTAIIVESLLQLWNQSAANKILVMAPTNTACDEIAARFYNFLKKIDPGINAMLRIYDVMPDDKYPRNINADILHTSNIGSGQHFFPSIETVYTYSVVITTSPVVGKYVHGDISKNHFTHVFIDECDALTEIETLVGLSGILSLNTQLIVSGDPKLVPIVARNDAVKVLMNQSLVERLLNRDCYEIDRVKKNYNKTIMTRLVRNYRNNKDILNLSKKILFCGELEACASPAITDWAIGWRGFHCKAFPVIFESIKPNENSSSAPRFEEFQAIIHSIRHLMFFGIRGRAVVERNIGVVVPYKKQCDLIRCELDRRGWFDIETGPLEAFQGKEKPIIIASTVGSQIGINSMDVRRQLGLLITRAQSLLIIVGYLETLAVIDGWKEVIGYCLENELISGMKPLNFDVKSNNISSLLGEFSQGMARFKNINNSGSHETWRQQQQPPQNPIQFPKEPSKIEPNLQVQYWLQQQSNIVFPFTHNVQNQGPNVVVSNRNINPLEWQQNNFVQVQVNPTVPRSNYPMKQGIDLVARNPSVSSQNNAISGRVSKPNSQVQTNRTLKEYKQRILSQKQVVRGQKDECSDATSNASSVNVSGSKIKKNQRRIYNSLKQNHQVRDTEVRETQASHSVFQNDDTNSQLQTTTKPLITLCAETQETKSAETEQERIQEVPKIPPEDDLIHFRDTDEEFFNRLLSAPSEFRFEKPSQNLILDMEVPTTVQSIPFHENFAEPTNRIQAESLDTKVSDTNISQQQGNSAANQKKETQNQSYSLDNEYEKSQQINSRQQQQLPPTPSPRHVIRNDPFNPALNLLRPPPPRASHPIQQDHQSNMPKKDDSCTLS